MTLLSTCTLLTACGGGPSVVADPTQVEGGPANTQNPLVAKYTIASACQGQGMVEFGPDTSYGRGTPWYPVPGHYQPITILVAGMRASTTYHMRSQVQCLGNTLTNSDSTFTTGSLPPIAFPTLTVTRPNPSLSSIENPGIEMITIPSAGTPALFTDRDGNPIWYYDVGQANYPFTIKSLLNSDIILSIVRPSDSVLQEVDLAGTTIHEMTIEALDQKMQAAGFDFFPGGFHHDVLPLDNGHLIVLTNFVKEFTNLPGYPGTTEVLGDGLIDLDQRWNPVWAWNSFDYLDVNRHLNGLPDWTHANALVYSPGDGNVLLSMRHQSWVLKIDYSNGVGSGKVLWRLGYQGDFALTQNGVPTDDPSLWFSFQHFPSLVSQSGPQTVLGIWDNGDYRVLDASGATCTIPGPPFCYSRATIFQIDESAMVANLFWDDAPGYFSEWGGNINQLANGNVEFDVNDPQILPAPNVASEVQEVTQTSNPEVVWKMDFFEPYSTYRAYRVPSLYTGVTWQF